MRAVTLEEIEDAAERWCNDPESHKSHGPGKYSTQRFKRCAKQWFAFHKYPIPFPCKPPIHFATLLDGYLAYLLEANYKPATIKSWKSNVKRLLEWLPGRKKDFASLAMSDIDDFLAHQASLGHSPSGIGTLCQGLRSFLRYAGDRALCRPGLADGIVSPSIPLYSQVQKGPTWSDVRRVLARAADLQTPNGIRMHAVLCLAAVYALRGKEIASLQLHDIDWYKETLTIRRAKRGRVQQLPLQYEPGEAIIRYLRLVRPVCESRHVFITVKAPHRPLSAATICTMVGQFLKTTPSITGTPTAHALRHACATKLLNQGTSLQDISQYLGHKDAKSVSIYARYDTRTLKEIAAFPLKGIL